MMREWYAHSALRSASAAVVTRNGASPALVAVLALTLFFAGHARSTAGVIYGTSEGSPDSQLDQLINGTIGGWFGALQPLGGISFGNDFIGGIDSKLFSGFGSSINFNSALTNGFPPQSWEGTQHSFHDKMNIHDHLFANFASVNTPDPPLNNPDPPPQSAVPEPVSMALWMLGGVALLARTYSGRRSRNTPALV